MSETSLPSPTNDIATTFQGERIKLLDAIDELFAKLIELQKQTRIPEGRVFLETCRELVASMRHGFLGWTFAMIPAIRNFRKIGIEVGLLGDEDVMFLDSCDYRIYLLTNHWHHVRAEALTRYANRCAVCNSPDRLDVHHRTYERRGHELETDVIVLCRGCHDIFHKNGKLARPPVAEPPIDAGSPY
jgi:hypothetical protein